MDAYPPLAIVAWLLCLILAIVLWYRNVQSDRGISLFLFIVGFLFLAEYGSYSTIRVYTIYQIVLFIMMMSLIGLYIGIYVLLQNREIIYFGLGSVLLFALMWIYLGNRSFYLFAIWSILIWIGLAFLSFYSYSVLLLLAAIVVLFGSLLSVPTEGRVGRESLQRYLQYLQTIVAIGFIAWVCGIFYRS